MISGINPKSYDTLRAYLNVAISWPNLAEEHRARIEKIKTRLDAQKGIDGEDQHWCVGIARAISGGFYRTV